jgi:hypothetical protein
MSFPRPERLPEITGQLQETKPVIPPQLMRQSAAAAPPPRVLNSSMRNLTVGSNTRPTPKVDYSAGIAPPAPPTRSLQSSRMKAAVAPKITRSRGEYSGSTLAATLAAKRNLVTKPYSSRTLQEDDCDDGEDDYEMDNTQGVYDDGGEDDDLVNVEPTGALQCPCRTCEAFRSQLM